jgi:hypothetical protein
MMLTFFVVLVYRGRRRLLRQLSSLSPQSVQAIGLPKLEDRATAFNKYRSDSVLSTLSLRRNTQKLDFADIQKREIQLKRRYSKSVAGWGSFRSLWAPFMALVADRFTSTLRTFTDALRMRSALTDRPYRG